MNYTSHAELIDEHWALLLKEVVQRYVLPSSDVRLYVNEDVVMTHNQNFTHFWLK